jgi:hypothetical protein
MRTAVTKPTHGGARPGAGRPPITGATLVRVLLNPDQVATAIELGDGNKSAGIRAALYLAGQSKRTPAEEPTL